jgi:hypothetical protein
VASYQWSNTAAGARQVGAFGAITIKSSTEFDNMIFPKGSIFIFVSWVCEADDEGNLQGCLVEALEAHKVLTLPTKLTKDLARKAYGVRIDSDPDNNQS